ncbi:MAG: DUF4282 domain-containing protein [Roseimicrobium sp.]
MDEPTTPTSLPPGEPYASQDGTEKTLIGLLLDFSFESFVTPRIIKFLYIIALVGVALSTLAWIFSGGFTDFLWHIVVSPVVLFVGALLARAFVELILVAFKILELLRRLEAQQRQRSPKE